jgi:hypothetical protein
VRIVTPRLSWRSVRPLNRGRADDHWSGPGPQPVMLLAMVCAWLATPDGNGA